MQKGGGESVLNQHVPRKGGIKTEVFHDSHIGKEGKGRHCVREPPGKARNSSKNERKLTK